MTRTELIDQALKTARGHYERGINKTDMDAAYRSLCEIMAAELLGGGEVPLDKIGKLKIRETGPRKGRNPKTGEEIEIPAGKKIVFVASKDFKEALK